MDMSSAEAWERFAAGSRPRRPVNARGEKTWLNWTQYPDHGPAEEILGPLAGRRVLELGSGGGDNLAHLAALGALGTGVDIAPSRKAAAEGRWGHLPGLDFRTAEAVDFLDGTAETFDVVLSVFGAVWFTDPGRLLPAVRAHLAPGGVLAFSHAPPGSRKPPPGNSGIRHDHTPAEWRALLGGHGFREVSVTVLAPPAGETVGTLMARAVAG
ncbi:class I SAM-dependent DNA methyltransferase [Streptomyces sp. SCSIO ZS0520]|uniref:class I SAM-dependent DNA methyltransferase n=1 Tax=Streptomyces sp. SCSIO ZS0520 TaxID=2892996 RepID=UPI0021D8F113|nr:class I SAM-dependent methyltransferase [Streptomyces sp. SCSIO ZS0520]